MPPCTTLALERSHDPWYMQRLPHGTRYKVYFAGAPAWAFVPHKLPPDPPLAWSRQASWSFDGVMLALGRLGTLSFAHLPFDLRRLLIQREAVLSLATAGSWLSLEDLLMHEAGHPPREQHMPNAVERTKNSVERIQNTVAVIELGLQAVEGGQAP